MTNDPTPEEIAAYTGLEKLDREWLLDDRDVWVRNPHYDGPPTPCPYELDSCHDDADVEALMAHYAALAVAYDARKEDRHKDADVIEWNSYVRDQPTFVPTDDDLPF